MDLFFAQSCDRIGKGLLPEGDAGHPRNGKKTALDVGFRHADHTHLECSFGDHSPGTGRDTAPLPVGAQRGARETGALGFKAGRRHFKVVIAGDAEGTLRSLRNMAEFSQKFLRYPEDTAQTSMLFRGVKYGGWVKTSPDAVSAMIRENLEYLAGPRFDFVRERPEFAEIVKIQSER